MDMKRYDELTGHQGAMKLLNGERVTNRHGRTFFVDNGILLYEFEGLCKFSGCLFTDILKETWYIKKPFDVRAEMLARPNEWVGAFKNSNGEWMMIGFNENKFGVSVRFLETPTLYSPNDGSSGGYGVTKNILDNCIPIEDVPKEEL